jgi:hypothetical protein
MQMYLISLTFFDEKTESVDIFFLTKKQLIQYNLVP